MKKHELTSYMKLIAPAAVSLWTLAACGPPPGPVVSAYNGDSVHIIQPAFTSATGSQLLEMANSICQRGSKKFAEPVSQRQLPDYQTEYLFLCLNKP